MKQLRTPPVPPTVRAWTVVSAMSLWVACGPSGPLTGIPLAPGVAEAVVEHRVRGSELQRTRLVFPAQADGAPLPGPHPAVVFIQGGLVPEARYRWWAEALAREGFVVALPRHDFQLALFSIDDGMAARELLVRPNPSIPAAFVAPGKVAVAGHSLGGVVAAKLALQGGFAALLLEASLPDAPDVEPLGRLTVPSLSLAGANDCSASLLSVTDGARALRTPTALVVLDGVTHYQFTDSDQEDVARACASGVDLETAHTRIAAVARTFLQAALGPSPSVGAEALAALPGLTVTAR